VSGGVCVAAGNEVGQGSPEDLSGYLNMDGQRLDIKTQKIDAFTLKSVLQGQKVNIMDLNIQVTPQAVLKGNGWVDVAGRQFNGDLSTRDFPLTALHFLNISPHQTFKTLIIADNDNKLAVAIVPVSHQLDLKSVAQALGTKKSQWQMPPKPKKPQAIYSAASVR